MADIEEVLHGTLGQANVGLAAAITVLNPLAAEIDAAISIGLLPFQMDLSAAFAANLSLMIPNIDIIAAIKEALAGLIQMQAALSLQLNLPNIPLPTISAAISLNAALAAKLGMLKVLIEAMIAVKIPAQALAAQMGAALSSGGIVVLSFDGISDGTTLQTIGSEIATKFQSPIGEGTIDPTAPVSGVLLVMNTPTAYANLGMIIPTTP